MLRSALEADVLEITVGVSRQRRHSTGNFLLPTHPRTHYKWSGLFKGPAGAGKRSFPAGAGKPAEIVNVERKGRGQVHVGLKDDHVLPLPEFVQQPLQRHLTRTEFQQYP